jgi:hypothetical protein
MAALAVGGVEGRHIMMLKRGPKATNFEVATTTIRKYASEETPDASAQSTLSLCPKFVRIQ